MAKVNGPNSVGDDVAASFTRVSQEMLDKGLRILKSEGIDVAGFYKGPLNEGGRLELMQRAIAAAAKSELRS